MRALPSMLDDAPLDAAAAEQIVAVIEEMRGIVALEPRRTEPGCRECRRKCWYGFMLQRDIATKAPALADRLKSAADQPDFVNNYPKLVTLVREFAQDVTPFPVAQQHSHTLGFCYLVNSGATRRHVLRGFQNA